MTLRSNTVLFLLPLILVLGGCTQQKEIYLKDGIAYGITKGSFRGRWWNYYERGCSFAEGGFYKKSIADFKLAIQKREQDSWMARSYGMHFVSYFPHREMGVVHYFQGDYNQAIVELEHSMRTAPSAKTAFFLNKARAVKQKNEQSDSQPPQLNFTLKEATTITNRFAVTVQGEALDDTYVASIAVEGQQLPIELAEPRIRFNRVVQLKEGANAIRVKATDLSGKSTQKKLSIFCDHRGPLINLEGMVLQGNKILLSGELNDPGGLASFHVNGLQQQMGGPTRNMHTFSLTVDWGNVTLQAFDRVGNRTIAHLYPSSMTSYAGMVFVSVDHLLASPLAVTDSNAPLLTGSNQTNVPDKTPPHITLHGITTGQETYEEQFLIEGEVSDASALQGVTINGHPILEGSGRKIFFSSLEQLQPGKNTFLISAVDVFGNTKELSLVVTRKIQQVRQIGARMSLAILPFDKKGSASALDGIIYEKLLDSFMKQGRFNLVERQQLDMVLNELQFSASGLVDPKQALQIGKLLTAQTLLAGKVFETDAGIEIVARLIDTETSIVITSNDVYDRDKSLRALDRLLKRLAFKFKRDFPLLEGIILEVNGDKVLVDLGSEKNLLPHTRLLSFQEGKEIRHPLSGKALGSETDILAELKVQQVQKNSSSAYIIRQEREMQQLDKVITQ